jgi:hypothetical protein
LQSPSSTLSWLTWLISLFSTGRITPKPLICGRFGLWRDIRPQKRTGIRELSPANWNEPLANTSPTTERPARRLDIPHQYRTIIAGGLGGSTEAPLGDCTKKTAEGEPRRPDGIESWGFSL